MVGSFATHPVQAQSAGQTFFYSGGKRHTLNVSTKWAGVQLNSSDEAVPVEKELRTDGDIAKNVSPILHKKKNVLVVPLEASAADTRTRSQIATRLSSTRGVKRALRVFGDSNTPIIETDEILVQFKPGTAKAARQALLAQYKAVEVEGVMKMADGFLVRVTDPTATATDVANAIFESGQVLFSHPNYIWPKQKRFVPNDPLYPSQWHLNNTGQSSGQTSGTIGADIKAEAAWNITRGSSNIIIALIDDGLDLTHEDFQGKLVPGYDFADNDNDPSEGPADKHGTPCAGLAAANGNNGIGVSGVAPNVKLMPIRLIATGFTLLDEHDAFVFAADNGADVISCSWGPDDRDPKVQPLPESTQRGIDYAADRGRGGKGCVIFFAAGNGSLSADNDGYASYPKVISVVASTNYDVIASYCDFGNSVDLTAPGGGQPGSANIVTTDRTGAAGENASSDYFTNFTGTSAACPVAAGVAALALSINPNLTRDEVQALLQNNTDKIGSVAYVGGRNSTYGFGRINAFKVAQAAGDLYTVSGKVALANNTGVAGIDINTSPLGGYATTLANGTYSIQSPAGNITITPQKTGYFFTPVSRSLALSANTANLNFTALPFTISLTNPAANTSISGTTTLRATTTLDSVVQKIEFGRRSPTQTFTRTINQPIPDGNSDVSPSVPGVISDSKVLAGNGTVESALVSVNITHEWISDLIVKLIPPSGSPVILHARDGGGGQNIIKTYNVPLNAVTLAGTWKLEISDTDGDRIGTFNSWGMTVNPTWTTIGTSTAPASGAWVASWNSATAPVGTYDFRARATTTGATYDALNTNIAITAAPVTYTVTGRVTTAASVGVANVVITRSGSAATVLTDSSGNYTLTGLVAGTYTVTPSLAGRTFTPVNRSVTVSNANVTAINFTASTGDTTAPTVTVTNPANSTFRK